MKLEGKIRTFLILLIILIVEILFLVSCRYTRDASDTLFEETKVSTLLKKYEWFKDASAALDAKIATVQVYEARIQELEYTYKDVARKDWPRDEREQMAIWKAEMSGIQASYNILASEYNSQMAKINWRFCNRGDLPAGATNPLPREYKPYITN